MLRLDFSLADLSLPPQREKTRRASISGVQDKVQLALVSTAVIQLLDVYEWLAKGEVTHWAQICICKAYSREIEYNEDNTEQLAAFSVLDEME